MINFKEFISENLTLASQIADVIYRFTSGLVYGNDRVECHAAVNKVKNEGQELQAGRGRARRVFNARR